MFNQVITETFQGVVLVNIDIGIYFLFKNAQENRRNENGKDRGYRALD